MQCISNPIPVKAPFMEADRVVVSMLEFQGNVYVATQKGVYILCDDKLHHLEMVEHKG